MEYTVYVLESLDQSNFDRYIIICLLLQAMLSLMEDLLRSSYSEAWGDARQPSSCPSLVPPQNINLHHVFSALTNARPEFEIFTDYGLGTPLETSCLDNA